MAETRIFERRGECEIGDLFGQRQTAGAIADTAEQLVALVQADERATVGGQGGGSAARVGRLALTGAAQAGQRVAGGVEEHFAIGGVQDRKSTRLNSSHLGISYAVSCLK